MSKKYQLNRQDMGKVGKGAAIAGGGAALVYILQAITQTDFGDYTPMVVAISGVFLNFVRKWMQENA